MKKNMTTTMNKRYLLKGKKITLRKLKLSDADTLYKYAKDPAVLRTTMLPSPYKYEHATGFIRRSFYAASKNKWYAFAMVDNLTQEFVGVLGIHKVDKISRKAEIGYWVGKKYWGKGFGSEAVSLALPFCFKTIKLMRVYALALTTNKGSQKILLKNGFKSEGISRKNLFKSGKWHDMNRFALLREEYKAK